MGESERWWVQLDGQEMGPFTLEQLGALARAEHVSQQTPASTDQSTWLPLGDAIGQPWAQVIAKPVIPQPSAPQPIPWHSTDEARPRMPASIIVAILFVLQGALLHLIVAVALLADRRHPSVRRESVLTGTVALLLAMAGVGMAVALGTGRIWARNVLVVLWSLGLFYSLITIGEEPVLLGLLGIVLTVVALWALTTPTASHFVNKATALRMVSGSSRGRRRRGSVRRPRV